MKKLIIIAVMAVFTQGTIAAQMYIEPNKNHEIKILDQVQENITFRGDTTFIGTSPFIEISTFQKMVGLNKKIKKVSSQYNIIYMTDGNMLYKKELLWFKRPTFLCIEE
jgi:hypothetical protein